MINENNAKKFCSEDISLIENYDKAINDNSQVWHCHHKLEIQGKFINSLELLKKCGLYYNVPAWQLIFLTVSEHRSLHGNNRSAKTCQKISDARKGKHLSAKHRQKLSERVKAVMQRQEVRQKISKRTKEAMQRPEVQQKMSEAHKGKIKGYFWWNNGVVNKRAKECPGPEWKPGRIRKEKHYDSRRTNKIHKRWKKGIA